MNCAKCGTYLPETAKFCLECNHRRGTDSAGDIDDVPTPTTHEALTIPVDPPTSTSNQPRPGKSRAPGSTRANLISESSPLWAAIDRSTERSRQSNQQSTAISPIQEDTPKWTYQVTSKSSSPTTIPLTSGYVAIAAALLVVIGSLGPWISITAPFVGSLSINGTDGDGKISLCCGVIAMAVLAFLVTSNQTSMWMGLLAAVALGIAAAVGIHDWQNVGDKIAKTTDEDFDVFVRVGWGLQAMTVGAIVGAIFSLLQAVKASQHAS